MTIQNAMKTVLKFFNTDLHKRSGEIVGVSKTDEGWKVEIEVIEESEYMRKHGRNDLMALYEVNLSNELDVLGYARMSTRERGKVES